MAAQKIHLLYREFYPLRTKTLMRRPTQSCYYAQRLFLATQRHFSLDNIAIVGGGITGLATAYFAARKFPSASITLFEASERLGGAIESTRVTGYRPDDGSAIHFLCERGPRTLRANADRAAVTYELVGQAETISLYSVSFRIIGHRNVALAKSTTTQIDSLELGSEILTVPRNSPVAGIRYIMYPRHLVGLPAFNSTVVRRNMASVPAPSTLGLRRLVRFGSLIATEPLFSKLVPGVLRDMITARRPEGLEDDSIGHFVTRRWGSDFANNFMSAIMHGLYAGDIDELSMKALMPKMWELEEKAEQRRKDFGPLLGLGGVLREMMHTATRQDVHHASATTTTTTSHSTTISDDSKSIRAPSNLDGALRERLRDASVFSFRDGLQSLTYALSESLQQLPNVSVRTSEQVVRIDSRPLIVQTQSTESKQYDCVVATTPLNQLLRILPGQHGFSDIAAPAVTVMVVTLCYSKPLVNHPYRGFGYLIPRSIPLHWNPEKALGVIFDSDAMPGQDIGPQQGTKITVIFGGHWWAGKSESQLPSEDQCIFMARSLLRRHLLIDEVPIVCLAKLGTNIVPQYTVGHCERMGELHRRLLEQYGGRLRVAGSSYRGIGVHDCIFSAKNVVEGLSSEYLTGLESFSDQEKQ